MIFINGLRCYSSSEQKSLVFNISDLDSFIPLSPTLLSHNPFLPFFMIFPCIPQTRPIPSRSICWPHTFWPLYDLSMVETQEFGSKENIKKGKCKIDHGEEVIVWRGLSLQERSVSSPHTQTLEHSARVPTHNPLTPSLNIIWPFYIYSNRLHPSSTLFSFAVILN